MRRRWSSTMRFRAASMSPSEKPASRSRARRVAGSSHLGGLWRSASRRRAFSGRAASAAPSRTATPQLTAGESPSP